MNARLVGVVFCVMALLWPPATAQAAEPMHARISYDSGSSMVKGKDDADWSYASINTIILPGDALWVDQDGTLEVEMSGGSFLRMADGSKAEVTSMPPSANVRGWTGSFYVQRVSRSSGSFTFETPVCAVAIDRDSQVRFDLVRDGATTVTVRWGRATIITGNGRDVPLRQGERSYIDPGYLPSTPARFDLASEDAFDSWNRERARLLALGNQPPPAQVITKGEPIGYADLAPYGEWVCVDSSYYWRPTVVVDYVPYRAGHWSFVSGCGYTWVGDYPFCYVTSHYGRWTYNHDFGWIWTYRDTWAPAWVYSARVGPNFVWTPLDPWDRPCRVSTTEVFDIGGGVVFSISTTTYCPAETLLMGPCPVRPCTPVIFQNIPTSQINIWNIYVGGGSGHHYRPPAGAPSVRDYSPRRVIRGLDLREVGKEVARARVANLETTHGRDRFDTDQARTRHNVRTADAPDKREAQTRSARIDEHAIDDVRQRTQRWGSDHPISRSRAETPGASGTAGTTTQGRQRKPEKVEDFPRPMQPRVTERPGAQREVQRPDDAASTQPSDGRQIIERDRGGRQTTPDRSRGGVSREPAVGNGNAQEDSRNDVIMRNPGTREPASPSQRSVDREPQTPHIIQRDGGASTRQSTRSETVEPQTPSRLERSRETERPREVEAPRTIDRPREVESPRTIERPREVEQPRTIERPREVEQPRTIERPREVESPRVIERPHESSREITRSEPPSSSRSESSSSSSGRGNSDRSDSGSSRGRSR